jgi:hypothetical protein
MNYRSAVLAIVACAIGTAQSTWAQDAICPCGLEGVLCDQLVDGFTTSLNASCSVAFGDATCETVPSSGKARCLCTCGVEGEFCDVRIAAHAYNFALGYGFCAVYFAFAAFKFQTYKRETGFKEFEVPALEAAQPMWRATPNAMLCFRVSSLIFCFGTLVGQIVYYSGQPRKYLIGGLLCSFSLGCLAYLLVSSTANII